MAGPSAPAASCAGADAESAAPPHGRRDTEPVHESREFSSCQQHSPSPASKPPPAVTAPTGVYVPNSHSSSNSKSDASIEGGQPTAGARNEPAQLPPPAQSDSSRAESGGSKRGGVLTGRKRKFTPEQNLGTRRSPRLAEQGSDVEGADAFFLQLSIADSESARQRSKRIRKIGSKRPAAAPGTNGHVVTPVDKEGVGGIAVGKTGGAVAALAVSAPPVVSAYTCNNKKKPTPGAPPNGKKDDVSSTAENSGTDDMKMKSKSVKTRQPGGAAPAVLLFSPLATRGQRREKAVGKVSGKGAADGASAVSVSKGRARTGHANTSSIKNTAVGTSAPAEATPSPTTARDEATLYASKDFGRGAVSGRQGTSIDIPTLEPSVQEAMLQLVSEQFGPIAKSRRPAPKAAKGKVAKGTVAKGKVTKGTVKGKAAPHSAPDGASGGTFRNKTSVGMGTAAVAVGSAPAPTTSLHASWGGGERSAAGNGEDVSVVDKKSKRKTTKSGSKGKAVCSAILGGGSSVTASGDEGMLTTAQKTKKSTIDPDNSNAAPPSDPDGACGGRSGGESSVRAATATAAVASAAGNGEDVSVVDKKSKRKTTKSGSKGKAVCSAILGGGSSVAASGGMLTTAQKTKKSTIDPDNSNAAPPSDPDGACGGRSGGESSVRAATATAAVAKVTVHAPIYTVHSGDRGDSGNSGEMSEFSARASIGGCVDEDRVKGGKKRKWSAGGEAKGQQEVEAEEGVSVEEHRAMTAERQYGADAEEKEVGVEERTAVMAAIADEGRGFKRVKVVASTPGQNHHQRDDTASASAVQPSPAVATELPPAVPTESAGKKTRVAVPPPNVDQSEANATSPGPTIEQQAPGSGTAAAAPVRATTATAIATAAAPVPAPVPSPAPPVVTKAKKKVGRKPVKKGKKPPPKSAEQVELERYTQSLTPEPPLHDVTDTPTPACFFLREEEPANGSYSDTVPTAAAPAQLAQVIDLTGFDDEDGDECDSAVGESGSDKKGKGRDMSFPTRSDDLAQKHLRENQDRYMDIVAEGKPCTDHNLIPPQVYGAKGGYFEHLQQPFRVEVHPNVLFVADVHAYAMDAAEIIGILAGRFDPVQNVLHVQAAVPCKEERREGQDKGHTDVAFDTMSYFEAGEAVQRQGLQMVGWYHSHPKFTPDPSPIDIKNHQTSQADEDANPASPCRMVGLIVGRQNSPSKFTWFRNETVTRRVSGTLEDREVLCPMLVETTVASGVPSSLRTQGRESGAAACTARKKSRDRARSRIYELDAQRRVKRARLEAVSGGEMMSEPASASAEESTTRAQAPPESDSSGMPSRLSTLAAVAAAAAAERDDHLGTRDDDVGPAAGDAAAAGGGQARTAAVLDGDFHAAIGGMARDPPLLFSGEVLRVLMGTSEAGGGDGVAGGSGEDAAGVQGGYGSETKVLVHALTSLGRYYARMARRAAWGNRSGMTPLERLSRSLAPTLELMEIPLSDAPDFLKDTALFLLSCFRETNASLARKTRGRGGPVKNTRAPRRSGRFGD